MTSIARGIESRLPREALDLLKTAGGIAVEGGVPVYLVGGVVRDLLLGRSNTDLDLVVEGNAPLFARQLSQQTGCRVRTHPHFGTATCERGSISLDLVTARSETFSKPGALPTVKPGTIRDDLFRRDFSVNAMAASLEPAHFGRIIDPFGGQIDLKLGVIRILHEKSFIDDPTRIWRAIRYEQRLGFKLEADTERLLRRDVAGMATVSGDRLRHELELILAEERPENALLRAHELGALRHLEPSLAADEWLVQSFEKARQADPPHAPTVYVALLVWRLDEDATERLTARLNFGKEEARVMLDVPSLKQTLAELAAQDLAPSAIYRLLEGHSPEAIEAAALATESMAVHERLDLYLMSLRFVKPSLDGHALKDLGIPQGRKTGEVLRLLLEAKLDLKVATREEEEALVREWLK